MWSGSEHQSQSALEVLYWDICHLPSPELGACESVLVPVGMPELQLSQLEEPTHQSLFLLGKYPLEVPQSVVGAVMARYSHWV